MEDNYLKEIRCMARTLQVLDEMVEDNIDLTSNLAKFIELKGQIRIHKIVQAIGANLALFCMGLTMNSIYSNDANEIYAGVVGTLGSGVLSVTSRLLKIDAEDSSVFVFEDIEEILMRLMCTQYDVGIAKLSKEEQERFFQILISTIVKDKEFIKKIKSLNEKFIKSSNFSDNNEMK